MRLTDVQVHASVRVDGSLIKLSPADHDFNRLATHIVLETFTWRRSTMNRRDLTNRMAALVKRILFVVAMAGVAGLTTLTVPATLGAHDEGDVVSYDVACDCRTASET